MNLVDATVVEVTSKPYEQYGRWWLEVRSDCWGSETDSKLMFTSEEQALAVKKGYQYLT